MSINLIWPRRQTFDFYTTTWPDALVLVLRAWPHVHALYVGWRCVRACVRPCVRAGEQQEPWPARR